ncbi:hypothetical protein B566_EDAN012727 [Ephemera danica]|nr:hypothetical protein B566_EDAN012727 [Ephemera danica]
MDDTSLLFDPIEEQDQFHFHGIRQVHRDITKTVHKNMQFDFDYVFGPETTNTQVYEAKVHCLIESLLNGYNCSVFAYGATGSGKTYTMLGNPQNPGITTQLMDKLYLSLDQLEDTKVEVLVSYLEIYNEMVHDLLVKQKKVLQLREDGSNVVVAGLSWHHPQTANELMALLYRGNARRTQHPTDANEESSRSHAVFQVILTMRKHAPGSARTNQVRQAKLSMVDLAGSERASSTTNNAERFIEGANINKSLLSLGNCIIALADGLKHVPFRNSKLTRLLKGSLGGNCRTVMVANISPSFSVYEDTYNTLKYATRAKKIKTKARKNQRSLSISPSDYAQLLNEKNTELTTLRARVSELQLKTSQLKAEKAELLKRPVQLSPALQKVSLVYEELQKKLLVLFAARENLCKITDEIDKHTADARSNFEKQLASIKPQIESHKQALHHAQTQLRALAETCGPEAINILNILRLLLQSEDMPAFVESNMKCKYLHEMLRVKSQDQEELHKIFCLLAEKHHKNHYTLKGVNLCSPEMEENLEKLRTMLHNHQTARWKEEWYVTNAGESGDLSLFSPTDNNEMSTEVSSCHGQPRNSKLDHVRDFNSNFCKNSP